MIHMIRTTSWVLFSRLVFCGRSQAVGLVYSRRHARRDKVACGSKEHGREDKLDDPEGYEDFLQPWRLRRRVLRHLHTSGELGYRVEKCAESRSGDQKARM